MAVSEEESSSANNGGKSRSASNGAYYVAKCVLKGSVVLQVVRGHIRAPSSEDVVFGKETSIELVTIDEDGVVQSVCEQPVFGIIKDLAILPWNERFHARSPQMLGKDLLIVLSDSGKLSFLTFSNELHRFIPLTHVQISSPGNSRHQVGRMLAVDSNGCYIAASAYEDRLALYSVSVSAGSDIIDKKVLYPSEIEGEIFTGIPGICGTIWSMCFISTDFCQASEEDNPILAIIVNRKGSFLNELVLLEWKTREHAVHMISQYTESGPLLHNIVEVPRSSGLALIFRVGDVLLMDLSDAHNPCCIYRLSLHSDSEEEQNFVEEADKKHDLDVKAMFGEEDGMFNVAASALLQLGDIDKDDDPMNIDDDNGHVIPSSNYVCSWSWEPVNLKNARLIFCLNTGELFMIETSSDSNDVKVRLSDCLYKGLPCKGLLWVEGGFLAALVEMGDGMVLRVEEGRLLYRSAIQNIAPILDMSVVDCQNDKHNQIFACAGVAPEGSLRIIRSGISVENLLKTAPIYQGVTDTWTLKMKTIDSYHAFLVLSFVEETRVLSVGVSFTDVTDMVGFRPDVCTLACGLVADGVLVQVHQSAVNLCSPTRAAHPGGIPFSSPICTSWSPNNMSISLGAVGHNLIVVATSCPCFLFVLGVRLQSPYHYEVYQMQQVRLQTELSCISIPQKQSQEKPLMSHSNAVDSSIISALILGADIGNIIVIGTHKPSVELLCLLPDKGIKIIAVGTISLTSIMGTSISGCVPQNVRLVLVDRLYILSGLRNGMLLRFEWPSVSALSSLESPSQRSSISSCLVNPFPAMLMSNPSEKIKDVSIVNLQLIAIRRIGVTPVFLVPLNDSLDADIIALSDRPWLLHTARHSLSYTSISFQPSTHVTPVRSFECPKGIIFVAENSLHLVEMVHSKRLNVQKFHLGGTPRKVLYHSESKLLLVMRSDLSNDSCSSDICCVDPLSGSVHSSFKLDPGETGKCMELVKNGNEHVLIVGTSLSAGPAIMASGEAESTRGRLIVLCLEHVQNSDSDSMTYCSKAGSSSQRNSPFREIVGYAAEQLPSSSLCSSPDDNSYDGVKLDETEAWHLRLASTANWPGMVLAVCPYLDRYFLASAGNAFYVCGFPNDNSLRVKRWAVARTRFMIMTLTTYFTRISVGDCRDGVLFYAYHEDTKKLEQLYCDPVQRLVAACTLMDVDTAVVSDRKGSIAVLSCSNHLEENHSPECNLTLSCSYFMGEVAMSVRKGSFSYKLPADDVLGSSDGANTVTGLLHSSIMASTLLGSIIIFVPLSRDEYELLEALQSRLVVHPLTAPILGNDHNVFRSRDSPARVPKILDGDMLAQFLELTSMQQEAVLALPLGSPNTVVLTPKSSPSPVTVNQVVRLLERLHYALN